MPATSSRAFSPPQSVVSSGQGSSSPVHVKKVVVDGRSRAEGATLRMYLKLSVATDNAQPGTSIPLFPEDNVRIITSEVQPLDERSVPYYFSATEQPLLQKTAIALQLGPKSSRPYQSLFPDYASSADSHGPNTSRRHRENNVPPSPDVQHYIGRILVSGYHVTLVLPKEFPPKPRPNADSDGDDPHVKEVPSSWSTRSARRSSIFNKNYLHLMVGIELFLPYVLMPPRGPFLVSIPVPRCLDNHLKMRIAIPPSNSTTPRSLVDSASSGDDSPGWDFLTDPPVSRKIDKSSRRPTYNQVVDDEQSDAISAPSTPATEVIQGAFQSTDFLHIRWAPPLGRKSGAPKAEDGMRRVSVQSTQGRMKCHILARDKQSVCMGIIYEGTCTGLWHPGVATILGMDAALDVKGRRVTWSEEDVSGWAVTGEEGFGGLYSEAPPPVSRKTSLESNFSSTWLPTLTSDPVITSARGSASLLRAPLPVQNTPEYSFEASPNGTGTPSTPANIPSLSVVEDVKMSRGDAAPGKVVTLKINLVKLLPPAKNELNFMIRGVIIVDVEQEDFLFLPEFRVLGSHPQDIKTWVSSRTKDAAFYTGEQSAQAPKRRLRAGEEVRCEDAVGLFVGPYNATASPPSPAITPIAITPSLRKIPSRNLARRRRKSNAEATSEETEASPQLPTLQQLPCVLNTVTPLLEAGGRAHCVRVNIPMYSLDADTIQFGLAVASSSVAERSRTTIDVLYASYAGRQVYVEVVARDSPLPPNSPTTSVEDSRIVGEIHSLLVVHFEDVEADTGEIEVVYVVTEDANELHGVAEGDRKGKGKEREKDMSMNVLLPCFYLPVARYEVDIERPPSEYLPRLRL
ncbi:hypothetical protein BU17DRAFT_49629 [Hysterangium stoloniferum]|nr:hypothetical protein BU17DRAFT_49629 [Hysterangium stoloniferum]